MIYVKAVQIVVNGALSTRITRTALWNHDVAPLLYATLHYCVGPASVCSSYRWALYYGIGRACVVQLSNPLLKSVKPFTFLNMGGIRMNNHSDS